MKILIAEDDLVTREMLKRVLRHMADEIVEASDGLEALEKIESENPDFLFTDLQMPELDGKALLTAIRSSSTHSQLPVVCMSAVKDKDEITALVALGIQDYVLKPIRPADVAERFRKVISNHSSWRRQQSLGGRRTLMLVDPDPRFRDMARQALSARFAIIEATSGAQALRIFRESELKPAIVIMPRALPLLGSVQLCGFLEKLASELQVPCPQCWLCDEDEPPTDIRRHFAGYLRRTLEPAVFRGDLDRTLLRDATPAERVSAFIRDSSRQWLLTTLNQALEVATGEAVSSVEGASPSESGTAARGDLRGAGVAVAITVQGADALVSTSGREGTTPDADNKLFQEIVATVRARVQSALEVQGFSLSPVESLQDADGVFCPSTVWDVKEWFATASQKRVFVGLAVSDGARPSGTGA